MDGWKPRLFATQYYIGVRHYISNIKKYTYVLGLIITENVILDCQSYRVVILDCNLNRTYVRAYQHCRIVTIAKSTWEHSMTRHQIPSQKLECYLGENIR